MNTNFITVDSTTILFNNMEIKEIVISIINSTDPNIFIDFFCAMGTFLWIGLQILFSVDGKEDEQQSSSDTKNTETTYHATGGNGDGDGDGDDDDDKNTNKSNKRKREEEEENEENTEESTNKKQKLDEPLSPTSKDNNEEESQSPASTDSHPFSVGTVSTDSNPPPLYQSPGRIDEDDFMRLMRIRRESGGRNSWVADSEDEEFLENQRHIANDEHSDLDFDSDTNIEDVLEERISDLRIRLANPDVNPELSETDSSVSPSAENQNNNAGLPNRPRPVTNAEWERIQQERPGSSDSGDSDD